MNACMCVYYTHNSTLRALSMCEVSPMLLLMDDANVPLRVCLHLQNVYECMQVCNYARMHIFA